MKLLRPLLALPAILAGWCPMEGAAAAPGSVDPLIAPRFEHPGDIYAMIAQPDGKWVVGGDFTAMNGVARGRIARLNADGSLDTGFDPGPKPADPYDRSYIFSLSQQGDKILAAGFLTELAGHPASPVARLNADGTRDLSFAPPEFQQWNDPVAWVAVDRGDGKILVGGRFSSVGGQPRSHLVRLDSAGAIDPTFNPVLNGAVESAVPVAGDKWLISGAFTTVSGQAQRGIARILANGDIDRGFSAVTVPNSGTASLRVVQADGKIVYAVRQGSNHLVNRALPDGAPDPQFTPTVVPGTTLPTIAILPDGDFVMGVQGISPEGTSTSQISRWHRDGGTEPVALVSGAGIVRRLIVGPDGSVTVGGTFSELGNPLQNSLARILPGGSLDPSFHPDATEPGAVSHIIPLSGDRWLVGGTFSGVLDGGQRVLHPRLSRLTSGFIPDGEFHPPSPPVMVYGQAVAEDDRGRLLVGDNSSSSSAARRIRRLEMDGSIDPSFDVELSNGASVADLVIQPDGSILAGGRIVPVNNSSQRQIMRLSPEGIVDRSFTPPTTGQLYDVALGSDGRILVGGESSLKRLQPSGLPDPTFNQALQVTGGFHAVASLPGHRVLVAGDFPRLNNQPAGRIARLDAAGNPDPGFQPGTGVDGVILSMQVRSDGDIFIAGDFTTYDGQPRRGLAQLSPDGALRASFDPGEGFNGRVNTVALTADGNVVAGGSFHRAGGLDRMGFAYVHAAPLQERPPAPTGPLNVVATPLSSRQVLILWADGQHEDGYFVERREAGTSDWLTLANLPAGSNSWQDDGTVPGRTYEYRVLAWNPSGDAPYAVTSPVAVPDRTGLPGGLASGGELDLWHNGDVTAIARQADGKIIIAGEFTHIDGVPRARICRLHPDGAPDTTFVPPSDFTWIVEGIAVQSTGKILIYGRGGPLLLHPDGSVDVGFLADLRGEIYDVAVLPDDKMLVAGSFTGTRPYLARLHPDGTLDTAFPNVRLDALASALAIQPDGKIVVGGRFNVVNFSFTTSIVRFNPDGTRDTGFAPVLFGKVPGSPVTTVTSAITLQDDGKILIGGTFGRVNDQPRSHVVRLLADGTLDSTFVADDPAVETVRYVKPLPGGRIAIAGYFQSYSGLPRSGWAVLEQDGTLNPADAGFHSAWIRDAVTLPDGKLVVIGHFWSAGGQPRLGIARLESDGFSLDPAFRTSATRPGRATLMHRQPDGKVLVMGEFSLVGGQPSVGAYRPSIFRLNADGALDAGFNAGSGFDLVPRSAASGPGGRIFIGGGFETVDGSLRRGIAALHPDGEVDVSFDPGAGVSAPYSIFPETDGGATISGYFQSPPGEPVSPLARLDGNGKRTSDYQGLGTPNSNVRAGLRLPGGGFWIGGNFTTIQGSPRNYLAKLLADGSLDSTEVPWLNGNVQVLLAGPGDAFYAGGAFTTVELQPRAGIARLTGTAALDPGFVPAVRSTAVTGSPFSTMMVDTQERLYIAGRWEETATGRTSRLLRLLPDGAVDRNFDVAGADAGISALAELDGALLVGGNFTEWNGQPRYGLVRVLTEPTLSAPASPSGLAATGAEGGVSLSWTATAGADGYLVERQGASQAWEPVGTAAAGSTSFLDAGASPGSAWKYRVSAFNAAGSSTVSTAVEVVLPTTFAAWMASHGIPAGTPHDDDSDRDGIPLLLEYALALSPVEADRAGMPEPLLHPDRLELRYLRARTDIRYTVETSPDLGDWSPDGVSQGPGGSSAAASIPRSTGPRFLRLSVELIP